MLNSVSWHPSEDILLTAGLDRKAKLISFPESSVVQEIFLEDLPILKTSFIKKGQQALFTGNRKHYYCYDLPSQKLQKLSGIMGHDNEKQLQNLTCSSSQYYCIATKQGQMLLMGQDSKKLLFDLKMNGSCTAVAFSKCETKMYSVGDQAEIYQWDLRNRKCIGKVQDTGAYSTTSLALTPAGDLLATGSKMGSVNLYHIDS